MNTEEWAKTLAISTGVEIGDYTVEQPLGRGGTASVYSARDRAKGNLVALKIFNPTMLDLEIEKRRLEERLAALKGHHCPYLVQPLSSFEAAIPSTHQESCQTLVEVSEYVGGLSLDPTRLPENRVRPVVAMICRAVRYLESRGLCHRDIKPDNILITQGATKAVLADIGVLHAYDEGYEKSRLTGTQSNHALVTLRYSSPEIVDRTLTPYSSRERWLAHTIYQIGAIIFEAITKQLMFENKSGTEELAAAIVKDGPFIGRQIVRCHDLEPIARSCLQTDPQERSIDWEALEYKRHARKPTVVLLYCGGTIGAEVNALGDTLLPRKLGPNDELPRRISKRLQVDYRDTAPDAPELSFEWRFASNELQIFSENANPEVWNGIADTVAGVLAEAENWSDNYLLGIVLLHGTDTLAYTASALQLAFPRLPCPLVLTGSNQPPSEESDIEQRRPASKSDAWTNILRSVLFLVDGGHRLAMVYVAFANTICHAVNVQKTPLNRIPIRIAAAFHFLNEAFSYRNVELGRRFAYKYVEGVLVNNFLPVLEEDDIDRPPPDATPAFWERRELGIIAVPVAGRFSSAVSALAVFPGTIPDQGTGLQLVVAYPSGTLADPVRDSLSSESILVTQWGLASHQAEYAKKLTDVGAKLFRLLPETALPLMSMAASQGDPDLNTAIAHTVAVNPVFKAMLGNPLNRSQQQARALHVQGRAWHVHQQSVDSMLSPTFNRKAAFRRPDRRPREPTDPLVTFRRHHFEALLYGLVAPHSHSGALPDPFGSLCDIGFDTGVSIAIEWFRQYDNSRQRHAHIDDLMEAVKLAIFAAGLATFEHEVGRLETVALLRVKIRIEPARQQAYADAWAIDSTADHRFLEKLACGLPLEFTGGEGEEQSFAKELADELARLQASDGRVRTSPLYWYLLGIVKGALCWILTDRSKENLRSADSVREEVVLRLLAGKGRAHFAFPIKLLTLAEKEEESQAD